MEGEAAGERRPGLWERDKANGSPLLTSVMVSIALAGNSLLEPSWTLAFLARISPSASIIYSVAVPLIAFGTPVVVVMKTKRRCFWWASLPLALSAVLCGAGDLTAMVSTASEFGAQFYATAENVFSLAIIGVAISGIAFSIKYFYLKIRRAKDAATPLQTADPARFNDNVWPPAPRV